MMEKIGKHQNLTIYFLDTVYTVYTVLERSLSFFETNNVNWHLHVRRLEREHDKASLYSLTVDGELGCNRIFVLRSRMKE